jgi:hypothetical protein
MIYKKFYWILINAISLIKGKSSINEIVNKYQCDGTIIVCERNGIKTFILGKKGSYTKINNECFKSDNYKNEGLILMENIITINNNKIIDEGNGIGINEKRLLWVFK